MNNTDENSYSSSSPWAKSDSGQSDSAELESGLKPTDSEAEATTNSTSGDGGTMTSTAGPSSPQERSVPSPKYLLGSNCDFIPLEDFKRAASDMDSDEEKQLVKKKKRAKRASKEEKPAVLRRSTRQRKPVERYEEPPTRDILVYEVRCRNILNQNRD